MPPAGDCGRSCIVSAWHAPPRRKLIQDSEMAENRGRRAHWRGERKAVLVRVPVEVAVELEAAAAREQRSVSEHAALLLAGALGGRRVA